MGIDGGTIQCKELGFSIVVPPGAVNYPVTVSVCCSFREGFHPPNGYEFVSPVYLLHLHPGVRFLEKVTLSLHHWAKPSVSSLSFGFCQFPTGSSSHPFQVQQGGDFLSSEHYGKIDVDHFSGGVIMRAIRSTIYWISRVFASEGNLFSFLLI